MNKFAPGVSEDQLRAEFDRLVRGGAFKPLARFVTSGDPDERLQDAICQGWAWFRHCALDRDILLPTAVLVNFVRWRVTDRSRQFVAADGVCRKQDALDERGFLGGKFEVFRVDFAADNDNDASEDDTISLGLASSRGNTITNTDAAIDVGDWIATLTKRERTMLEMRVAGHGLSEIGRHVKLDVSYTCTLLHQLGHAFAAHAGVAQPARSRRGRPPAERARAAA